MLSLFDRLMATDEEKQLALKWADFAYRRFGDLAAEKLRKGLHRPVSAKSSRALRLAIRRAEANQKTKMSMANR